MSCWTWQKSASKHDAATSGRAKGSYMSGDGFGAIAPGQRGHGLRMGPQFRRNPHGGRGEGGGNHTKCVEKRWQRMPAPGSAARLSGMSHKSIMGGGAGPVRAHSRWGTRSVSPGTRHLSQRRLSGWSPGAWRHSTSSYRGHKPDRRSEGGDGRRDGSGAGNGSSRHKPAASLPRKES